jgi:hypothetical protein
VLNVVTIFTKVTSVLVPDTHIMFITVAIVLVLDMVTIFSTVASVPLRSIVAFFTKRLPAFFGFLWLGKAFRSADVSFLVL